MLKYNQFTLHMVTHIDAINCATETSPIKGCSGSADIDDDQCSTRRALKRYNIRLSFTGLT